MDIFRKYTVHVCCKDEPALRRIPGCFFFFFSVHPVVYALNLVCILLFIFDLVVHIVFLTWPVFWSRSAEGGLWNG